VVSLAAERGCEVEGFRRGDIEATFAGLARTRHEIAITVARQIPALEQHLPKKRSAWDSEDKRLAIFCAAAVVLTYFHAGATRLFDDLKRLQEQ
jgi:hypothetical protein